MKNSNVTGEDLQYYHPMSKHGYWAENTWAKGELAPFEVKSAKKVEDSNNANSSQGSRACMA